MKTKAKTKWVLELRNSHAGSWSRWGIYDSKEAAARAGEQRSARTGEGYQVRKEVTR